jgi:hypothetical protein
MGWNEGFLQNAVDTCTSLSGEIYDCPLFTIQDDSVSSACQFPIPAALESENAEDPGSELPGNVQIQSGPAYATHGGNGGSPGGAHSAAVPTLSYSAGSSTNIAGGVFAVATGSSSTRTTPSPTPTPAPTTNPLLPGESIVSTIYTTHGNEVMELVMVEQEVTVYVSTTATTMTTITEMKRKKHRRHGHAHAHDLS